MSANDLAHKARKLTDEQIEPRLAALESVIYWGHPISAYFQYWSGRLRSCAVAD